MKLLLLSNSTNPGEAYLAFPKYEIQDFLGRDTVEALFIPYAAVTFSYDDYEAKVNNRFAEIGHRVKSIHHFDDPIEAVNKAKAIIVGGGNTWKLTRMLHDNKLIDVIRKKVLSGTPFIGWSAGSNVACPTIRTTNDMPIVNPMTFEVMNFVPFQINPHYLDNNPENHGGETREQRIEEFITENQDVFVVGLREGTMLRYENEELKYIGGKHQRKARIFKFGTKPKELSEKDDFNFLMK